MARILVFPGKGVRPTPKDAWQSVKDDFETHLISQGCSEQTTRTYMYNVAYYARWCRAQSVSLFNAGGPQLTLSVAQELAARARSTAMNRLLACRAFYRYLVAARRRTTDPTARIPIKRDKLQPRRPFNEAELAALVRAAASHDARREALPVVLLLIGSGIRRGELVAMHTDDIDWVRGRILIHGKGSKERWVAPGVTAMMTLRGYVGSPAGAVAGAAVWPLSGQQVYVMIKQLGLAASVIGAHPHRFRITFAVTFLKHFGNLSALKELLGHESLRQTEHYATYGIAEGALAMQASLDLAKVFTLETGTVVVAEGG